MVTACDDKLGSAGISPACGRHSRCGYDARQSIRKPPGQTVNGLRIVLPFAALLLGAIPAFAQGTPGDGAIPVADDLRPPRMIRKSAVGDGIGHRIDVRVTVFPSIEARLQTDKGHGNGQRSYEEEVRSAFDMVNAAMRRSGVKAMLVPHIELRDPDVPCTDDTDQFLEDLREDARAQIDAGADEDVFYYVVPYYQCAFWGQAFLAYFRGWISHAPTGYVAVHDNTGVNADTLMHEFGHTFGLGHDQHSPMDQSAADAHGHHLPWPVPVFRLEIRKAEWPLVHSVERETLCVRTVMTYQSFLSKCAQTQDAPEKSTYQRHRFTMEHQTLKLYSNPLVDLLRWIPTGRSQAENSRKGFWCCEDGHYPVLVPANAVATINEAAPALAKLRGDDNTFSLGPDPQPMRATFGTPIQDIGAGPAMADFRILAPRWFKIRTECGITRENPNSCHLTFEMTPDVQSGVVYRVWLLFDEETIPVDVVAE